MVEKGRGNKRGVIIDVYVESRTLRSDRVKKRVPIRISSRPRFLRARKRGYDRRAQLLAYARELRQADAERYKLLTNSRRKSKKRRLIASIETIKRFFLRFRRKKRLWKYEPIVREDYNDGEWHWRFGRRKRFHFCKKLKCWWKKMCGAWK